MNFHPKIATLSINNLNFRCHLKLPMSLNEIHNEITADTGNAIS
jgi:hypothetical protein